MTTELCTKAAMAEHTAEGIASPLQSPPPPQASREQFVGPFQASQTGHTKAGKSCKQKLKKEKSEADNQRSSSREAEKQKSREAEKGEKQKSREAQKPRKAEKQRKAKRAKTKKKIPKKNKKNPQIIRIPPFVPFRDSGFGLGLLLLGLQSGLGLLLFRVSGSVYSFRDWDFVF